MVRMNCTAYIARAFCHHSLGGNPAGVVIVNQESFNPIQMQFIAKELNFSETIFISSLGSHSYKAHYFTPTSPIEFCGHATLAAFGVLKQLKLATDMTYTLETQVGKCEVILKDHLIFLSQPLPIFGEKIEVNELIPILGDKVISNESPPRIVSTGLPDILVRVEDEKCLQSLKPNLALMSELNRKTNSIGIHVFFLNPPGSAITAHCRNFAPLYGINEESATGSSNGSLACYLFENGLLSPDSSHKLLFRQGDSLNAPSDIYVRLSIYDGTIKKVECGGEVVIDETRELKFP